MLTEFQQSELNNLLTIPSNSNNHEALNEAGSLVQKMLAGIPISWESIHADDAADFFVGRSEEMDPNKPVVILSGHLDVVPEVNKPKIDGNYIHGAGTHDMKGGVYAIVEVVRRLHKKKLCKNLILALNTQEEIGNPQHGNTIMELSKEGDYVMVFEGGEESDPSNWNLVKTRKGARVYKISITQGSSSNIDALNSGLVGLVRDINSAIDYDAGTTVNMGVIKPIVGKKALKRDDVEGKEGIYFQLELSGPGGHSGNLEKPNERHSTVNVLIDALREIVKDEDKSRIVDLEGGSKVNAIPDAAEATLYMSGDKDSASQKISDVLSDKCQEHGDAITHKVTQTSNPEINNVVGYEVVGEYRFRTKEEDGRMRGVVGKSVKQVEAIGLTVENDDKTRFPNLNENDQTDTFIQLVEDVAQKHGIIIILEDSAGSSDGNYFSGGNPNIAVLDGFGPKGSEDHTTQERMDLRTLETSIKFSQDVVEKLLDGN